MSSQVFSDWVVAFFRPYVGRSYIVVPGYCTFLYQVRLTAEEAPGMRVPVHLIELDLACMVDPPGDEEKRLALLDSALMIRYTPLEIVVLGDDIFDPIDGVAVLMYWTPLADSLATDLVQGLGRPMEQAGYAFQNWGMSLFEDFDLLWVESSLAAGGLQPPTARALEAVDGAPAPRLQENTDGMREGVAERVLQAHKYMQAGHPYSWSIKKASTDHRTYQKWCAHVTGEAPFTARSLKSG